MAQLNVNADDALVEKVRQLSGESECSQGEIVELAVRLLGDPELAGLAGGHGWSREQTFTAAIRTLRTLLDYHESIAKHATDHDQTELLMMVARELPAGLVDLKDSVKIARLETGRPAVLLDGWTITVANDGELVGLRPIDSGFQMATIADGAIRVKAAWSPSEAEAALASLPTMK